MATDWGLLVFERELQVCFIRVLICFTLLSIIAMASVCGRELNAQFSAASLIYHAPEPS